MGVGEGTAGVAWNVSMMPIKIGSERGPSSQLVVYDALQYAAANGAKLVLFNYYTTESSLNEGEGLPLARYAYNQFQQLVNHSLIHIHFH